MAFCSSEAIVNPKWHFPSVCQWSHRNGKLRLLDNSFSQPVDTLLTFGSHIIQRRSCEFHRDPSSVGGRGMRDRNESLITNHPPFFFIEQFQLVTGETWWFWSNTNKTSERVDIFVPSKTLASLRSQRSTQEFARFSGILFEDSECGPPVAWWILCLCLVDLFFWWGLVNCGWFWFRWFFELPELLEKTKRFLRPVRPGESHQPSPKIHQPSPKIHQPSPLFGPPEMSTSCDRSGSCPADVKYVPIACGILNQTEQYR